MPTRNIKLTEHHNQFVDSLVASGRYDNASDVMRAGLRLLEQKVNEDESKLKVLRRLASDAFGALDQGEGVAVEGEKQLANLIGKLGRRAARGVKTLSSDT